MSSHQPPKAWPSVLIIGTGFGGLSLAIKLKKRGVESLTILEKAGSVGGTWRDNSYPGAACDVQSHLYSFSFEPKHDWSRKFGLQAEIKDYLEHCTDKYGIRSHIQFKTDVASAEFDAEAGLWKIYSANGRLFEAQVVITATGQLNNPAWPRIPGIDDFNGKLMHSAEWDHDYVLDGKDVAVIGSGASAVQFVPAIVNKVKSLTLFQRSAPWVLPKADRLFAGWEQKLFKRSPLWNCAYRASIYWSNEYRALGFANPFGAARLLSLYKLWALRHLHRGVRKPELRAKLTPDYGIGCKRILISNDWYPALDRDHVEVVTEGIACIEGDHIVGRDGSRHRVDAIILGTGFEATDFLSPMKIVGLNGRSLNEVWRQGAKAFKGVSVAGFPNLLMLYGPNTNLAHNSIVYMLESQADHVVRHLELLRERGIAWMSVKPATQDRYNEILQQQISKTVWATGGCTSWYQTAGGLNTNNWPGFTFAYRNLLRRVDLSDYDLAPSSMTTPSELATAVIGSVISYNPDRQPIQAAG